MVALIDWVVKDTAPPPSRYPLFAAGQLVRPESAAMGFPRIPGAPLPDHMLNPLLDYDFGPDFRANDMSGWISTQPPVIRQVLPSLVPKVDADGNEVGGVPSVLHQAPAGHLPGLERGARPRSPGPQRGICRRASSHSLGPGRSAPRRATRGRHSKSGTTTTPGTSRRSRPPRSGWWNERFLLPDDAARLVREAEASDVLRGGGKE